MTDIILTPADPWAAAIRDHDGDGTIYLADGDYEATCPVTIGARTCRVQAQNLAGARVTARWNLACQEITLVGLDLFPPPAGNRLLMTKLAYLELDDCRVDALAADIDLLCSINGGVLRVTSHARESVWDIGAGVRTDVLDLDSGAALKGIRWRMNFLDVAANLNGIVLDASKGMLADFRSFGSGNGTMIVARRASTLVFQGLNSRIQNVNRGILATQQSRVHASKAPSSKIVVRDCAIGMQDNDGGRVTYADGAVVFAGNGKDHIKD